MEQSAQVAVNGVERDEHKGPSIFLSIHCFDVVKEFNEDHMHRADSGALQQLPSLWFDTCLMGAHGTLAQN